MNNTGHDESFSNIVSNNKYKEQNTYCPEQAPMGAHSKRGQNLGVGGYTEKVLNWFNYPRARAHPGCEVSSHGAESTCIVGSSVLCRDQPDSGESCIVLKS